MNPTLACTLSMCDNYKTAKDPQSVLSPNRACDIHGDPASWQLVLFRRNVPRSGLQVPLVQGLSLGGAGILGERILFGVSWALSSDLPPRHRFATHLGHHHAGWTGWKIVMGGDNGHTDMAGAQSTVSVLTFLTNPHYRGSVSCTGVLGSVQTVSSLTKICTRPARYRAERPTGPHAHSETSADVHPVPWTAAAIAFGFKSTRL